jgi:mannose-6-phosphate isomerase-like protein (cupin superfamily)
MDFVRYDPATAQPLPGGTNATYAPVRKNDKLAAMVVNLDRRGDTGKREMPVDTILIAVSGEGRCRSGGAIADLKAGDIAILTGGMIHQIWTADSTLRVVLMDLTVG